MTLLLLKASAEASACAQAYRRQELRCVAPAQVAARLQQRASRAAASPLAFDQLLAICLESVAEHADAPAEKPPLWFLCSPPDPLEQLEVRKAVFVGSAFAPFGSEVAAAVSAEELRGERKFGRNAERLAGHLLEAAHLARVLWDHPELPTASDRRAAMLATVPALCERADALMRRHSPYGRKRREPRRLHVERRPVDWN